MGTNAALLTSKVIENAYQVLAVHLLTLAQTIDYLEIQPQMSTATQTLYRQLREEVPVFKEDTVMHSKLSRIRKLLHEIPQKSGVEVVVTDQLISSIVAQ